VYSNLGGGGGRVVLFSVISKGSLEIAQSIQAQKVALHCVCPGFEHLDGRRLHSLSGQPGPVSSNRLKNKT